MTQDTDKRKGSEIKDISRSQHLLFRKGNIIKVE